MEGNPGGRKAALSILPAAATEAGRSGPRVCIIGGGGTGAALAYDLSLRGCAVTLVERGELTSGTTGRHHGQLHCGARYAWADRNIARECFEENVTLSRIAEGCIEYNGGLFVAVDDDEADRTREFLDALAESGIPARRLSPAEALALEPALNPALKSAVAVPDGSFDAFRLPLMFFAAARTLGAEILPWHEVVAIESERGRVRAIVVADRSSPDSRASPGRSLSGTDSPTEAASPGPSAARELRIEADFFVSATGVWAGKLGSLAGLDVPISPAPGTMVAVRGRIVDRVVSRLRPPGDGDILVPQRGLSIIGTTQRFSGDSEPYFPTEEERRFLISAAAEMVPEFANLPLHAAWTAARPLFGKASSETEGRALSRDFGVIDHESTDGLAGFATIIGGKATVLRAMAEKTADLVCRKLGVSAPCRTKDYLLPSWRDFYREKRP